MNVKKLLTSSKNLEMAKSSKDNIKDMRTSAIFQFCNDLHTQVDELYEVMVDGTDDEEKVFVESFVKKIQSLNIDR